MVADIKPELDQKQKKFLSFFPNTLYCYIPDHNPDAPVIHSEELFLSRQKEGYGIFFTVNGFMGGKRTGETLTNVNAFFADIDFPNKMARDEESVRQYKQDLLMELMESELPIPKYIVETKNGLHVYWMLKTPVYLKDLNPQQQENMLRQYRNIEEAIIKKYDGDPGAKDVSRVLRVPGTIHQKNPNNPFTCKIVHAALGDECLYSWTEMREAFMKPGQPDGWAVAQTEREENAITPEVKIAIEAEYPRLARPSFKSLFSKEPGSIPEGMRNKALLIAAYAAKESGWTFEKTADHFDQFHGLSLREIRKTIRSAFDHVYDFGYNNEVMRAVVPEAERVQLSRTTSNLLSSATKEKRETSNNQQKEKYQTYEYVIGSRYPHLIYKLRGDFYNYADGVYAPIQMEEVRSIFFREMLEDGLTNYRKVSAIGDKLAALKSLKGRTFLPSDENPDDNILNFKNGLLDIHNYMLGAHTPQYLSTSQIPIFYNHAARCPKWMRFLQEVTNHDEDQMKLLQQIAGYCLTTDTRYAKAFIFYGSGANGKSLFCRMIGKLVGRANVSNINLSTLTKQFGLTGIIGKKVNFIDEISGHYFESNMIKGIISGEPLSADVKFRPEPLEFTPIVKLIFSVNELPKINDTTPGLYRRFLIVPFDRSFESQPDLRLEEKLSGELTGILNWAIEGLKSLRADGRFNETKRNRDAMKSFKSDNSPLVEFLGLHYDPVPSESRSLYEVPVVQIYSQYRNYCFDNGYKPKAIANFSREMFHGKIEGYDITKSQVTGKIGVLGLRKNSTIAGDPVIYQSHHNGND